MTHTTQGRIAAIPEPARRLVPLRCDCPERPGWPFRVAKDRSDPRGGASGWCVESWIPVEFGPWRQQRSTTRRHGWAPDAMRLGMWSDRSGWRDPGAPSMGLVQLVGTLDIAPDVRGPGGVYKVLTPARPPGPNHAGRNHIGPTPAPDHADPTHIGPTPPPRPRPPGSTPTHRINTTRARASRGIRVAASFPGRCGGGQGSKIPQGRRRRRRP